MSPRIPYNKIPSEVMTAFQTVEKYLHTTTLEPKLRELVKMRASQINGCAYCLDMHTKDAKELGETEQRMYCLPAWHECPFYTDRERAALAWTETVTLVSETGVPDEAFEKAREQFSERELVDLTLAITSINTWNRLSVSFRPEVGNYKPHDHD
ncbi:MAG: carboxymuconolactone decarboxylase family protein [Armatimonadetes bacterium]|nr:carboxymuconolactone decarboxylase family protein [Armatimonadota bacterium]